MVSCTGILAILIAIFAGSLLNLPILLILESHEQLDSKTLQLWSLAAVITTNLSVSQILLATSKNRKAIAITAFTSIPVFIFLAFSLAVVISELALAEDHPLNWIYTYTAVTTSIIALFHGVAQYWLWFKIIFRQNLSLFFIIATSVWTAMISIGTTVYCGIKSGQDRVLAKDRSLFIWAWITGAEILVYASILIVYVFSSYFYNRGVTYWRRRLKYYSLRLYVFVYSSFGVYWMVRGIVLMVRSFDDTYMRMSSQRYFMFNVLFYSWSVLPGVLVQPPILLLSICKCSGKLLQRLRSENVPSEQNNDPSSIQHMQSIAGAYVSLLQGDVSSVVNIHPNECRDDTCPICWEVFREGERLIAIKGCKHSFHHECLAKWSIQDPVCPICRSKFKKKVSSDNMILQTDNSLEGNEDR